eukprot:NODE_580_length_6469_cov_0.200628.p5 type:complete len:106 gc:universal NODE_580_length_6469_cov_0.200628:656-339(-)
MFDGMVYKKETIDALFPAQKSKLQFKEKVIKFLMRCLNVDRFVEPQIESFPNIHKEREMQISVEACLSKYFKNEISLDTIAVAESTSTTLSAEDVLIVKTLKSLI